MPSRPRSPFLLLATLGLLLCVSTGCRTTSSAIPGLAFLRGRPLLLVAEAAEGAAAAEAELTRALALAPVRMWPGEVDGPLQSALGELVGASRVEEARRQAEERRVAWVLVREEEALRVEDARGGGVRWRRELALRERSAPRVATLLGGALGEEEAVSTARSEVRLAGVADLGALRDLLVAGDYAGHAARASALTLEHPADPAVMLHATVQALLATEPSPEAQTVLRRVIASNAEGESELFAIALAADGAGKTPLALRAREVLVQALPLRPDYRPELAELQTDVRGAAAAVATCRGGFEGLDGEALRRLPAGTAPHEAPDALPYADLRFSLGWSLALDGQSEAALLAYEHALDVYAALGRPRELSDTLNNVGVALVELGRPVLAVPTLRKAWRLRSEQGRGARAATSRHNLARALADSRRTAEAIEAFEAAAKEHEAVDDALAAAESLYETLDLHAEAGDREALERRVEEIQRRIGGLREQAGQDPLLLDLLGAATLFDAAAGRSRLGDPEAALAAYSEALAEYRRVGRRLDEAQTLYAMAIPHLALLRFVDAHGDLVGALGLAVELGDSSSIGDIGRQLLQVEELMRGAGQRPPPIPEELRDWLP